MTSVAPLLACPGVPSYATLCAAWDAIQTDRGCANCIPFRCSTCRVWHLSESQPAVPLSIGRVRAAGQGHESTLDNEHVKPTRGPAEPLTTCVVCGGRHGARRGVCPWCATREAAAA